MRCGATVTGTCWPLTTSKITLFLTRLQARVKIIFKFENGVLSPKDTKNIDGDGATANIKSTLKVAGKSYDMTYAAVTLKAKTEFVGTFETEKFDYASEYSKSMSASSYR